MSRTEQQPAALERLLAAVNAHDLDALISCFAEDYANETPVHPQRGFHGKEQVRRNWAQIFTGVGDLHAEVPRHVVDGNQLWTEWEMSGRRGDGAAFLMRGVVIFGLDGEAIRSSRFYLEPVELGSGDVEVHTRNVVGATGASAAARQP